MRREVVISVGGGAVLDAENRRALEKNGVIVLLTCDHLQVRRPRGRLGAARARPRLARLRAYVSAVSQAGLREEEATVRGRLELPSR